MNNDTSMALDFTVAGMTEPPLNRRELAALGHVLLETGEGVPREAQIEMLQTIVWLMQRTGGPVAGPSLKAVTEIAPAVADGYLRGMVASEPELPARVIAQLGIVSDALARTGAMIETVYETWAETEDAEARAEAVRALVRGWRG